MIRTLNTAMSLINSAGAAAPVNLYFASFAPSAPRSVQVPRTSGDAGAVPRCHRHARSVQLPGLGTVVIRSHSQPSIDLTYVGTPADAGDQYTGLDRFGRVVDQRWLNPTTGTATDRFQYGYDAASNRLYRDNLVNTAFGELYSYDAMDQLASFDRGTLNGTKTGLTAVRVGARTGITTRWATGTA